MHATRAAVNSAKMACSIQKQASQPTLSTAASITKADAPPKLGGGQRSSLPSEDSRHPPLDYQWPQMPVSTHTSNLRLTMMNQNPKDLHTARLIIEELRAKVRYQTEHIMKWRKAYALQIQQHYRYQKEKTEQMNSLTSQLLLLESRLKRKQKQISSLLNHRELTIQRQQKIIDTLSTRLVDHGLETIEASYATELDSLNDSDSAVVLEDIDSDSTMTLGLRRRSSGGGGGMGSDGITIVRSISDAIETNLNKYGGVRRNNCFLRRPDILETVYSVEEDPEPTSDVAEKRDKFKNRSEKALSSSSTEGQIDNTPPNSSHAHTANPNVLSTLAKPQQHTKESSTNGLHQQRQLSSPAPPRPQRSPAKDGHMAYSVKVPQRHAASVDEVEGGNSANSAKTQVTNYNRVMNNHRSVNKPKDVKYKRINKAKSKSLEELRGRLKNLVERGSTLDAGGYTPSVMPQTAQSYA